jgi:hypothetical protein
VRPVDGLRHLPDLVLERALDHAGRRPHLGAEDTHADAADPAQRAEPVALVERELHGRVPVGLDPEADRAKRPRVPGPREGDRHLRERGGTALELCARLLGGQPADVDAVDADARGDPARGARKREPDHGGAGPDDDRQHDQPLHEQRAGTAATPAADPDRSSPCLDAQGRQSSDRF